MLYQPERYEPLAGDWDEEGVRSGIRAIVAGADAAFGAESLWPANDWDSWRTPTPLKTLYVGAAGVIWALDELRSRGHAEPRIDLEAAAEETLAEWRREPDLMAEIELPSTKEAGLLSGETGILLVASQLTGSREHADDLYERVRENEASEAEDLMWGTPGTLVAARKLLERTGEQRWREACEAGVEALWSRRDGEGYWTQRLHGEEYRGSARRTGSWATSRRCGLCSTRSGARGSSGTRMRCSRGRPSSRKGSPTGPTSSGRSSSPRRARSGCSGARARRGS